MTLETEKTVTVAVAALPTLDSPKDWPRWISAVRQEANNLRVWHIIDPDTELATEAEMLGLPVQPTQGAARQAVQDRHLQAWHTALQAWKAADPTTRGEEPQSTNPTEEEIRREFLKLCEAFSKSAIDTAAFRAVNKLREMINVSVSDRYAHTAHDIMEAENVTGTRGFIQTLRKIIAPSNSATFTALAEEYATVLARGSQSGVEPRTWILEYMSVLHRARAANIAAVTDATAVTTFLKTVQRRLDPEWATRMLKDISVTEKLGGKGPTLLDLALSLEAILQAEAVVHPKPGAYPVLPGAQNGQKGSQKRKKNRDCPCKPKTFRHWWFPSECRQLRYALTGESLNGVTLPNDAVNAVRQRFAKERWNDLRVELQKLGWKIQNASSNAKTTSSNSGAGPSFPGALQVHAVIDPAIASELEGARGVFASLEFGPHPLSKCILFDNCGAVNLVNDRALLVPGTFVKTSGETVEAGTTSFPISGRGKWIIKNVLNGARGPNTEDLVIDNVAVVEGFHVNIVSERRLRAQGAWYCGLDCTLRWGTLEKSIVLRQLVEKFNLTFLQYNALSS
ncbi:uncharacterized protein THITE_109000, partial [Thermothielavioides terrestris NRRL 8126]